MSDATVVRYERCVNCTDGSCRACGQASSEHAAPGVQLVIRHVRFVACICATGCPLCGTNVHPLASPGVTVEIAEEHSRKRWVPSVHLRRDDKASCGTSHASDEHLTNDRDKVTCSRCRKWR